MRYHMRDVDTGEEIEIDRPVCQAPDFGVPIKWKRRTLVRPMPEVKHMPRPRVAADLLVKGWRCPPGVPGATAYMDEITGKISNDPSGVPLYDSERDLQRTAKETKGEFTHARLLKGGG
jgi:hypothetical protein